MTLSLFDITLQLLNTGPHSLVKSRAQQYFPLFLRKFFQFVEDILRNGLHVVSIAYIPSPHQRM